MCAVVRSAEQAHGGGFNKLHSLLGEDTVSSYVDLVGLWLKLWFAELFAGCAVHDRCT